MKICAYGWGYGGYLTSMLLTKDSVESPTFHCYVAVAPIVSFQYYSEYISLVWVEWTSRIIECQFSQFPFSHSLHSILLHREIFRLSPNARPFATGSRLVTAGRQFSVEELSADTRHGRHARTSAAHDATDKVVDTEGCHFSTSGEFTKSLTLCGL